MGMTTYLKARALRWVSDEPFPGMVAVEIVDAAGIEREFIDKYPMFGKNPELGPATPYPMNILIACSVLRDGEDGVVVSTAEPWGLEATDGTCEFTVNPADLVEGSSE
jgi:hypothetical protein